MMMMMMMMIVIVIQTMRKIMMIPLTAKLTVFLLLLVLGTSNEDLG
jgi:hypothetical protein